MGSFHLSLTVLLHYRCMFASKLRGWFPVLQTDFFRFTYRLFLYFNGAITLSGKGFNLFKKTWFKKVCFVRFRSPLLPSSRLISFHEVLRWFTSLMFSFWSFSTREPILHSCFFAPNGLSGRDPPFFQTYPRHPWRFFALARSFWISLLKNKVLFKKNSTV